MPTGRMDRRRTAAAVGARFVGHNRGGPGGLMKWSRSGRVLVADLGLSSPFVTEEGGKESTIWRYQLEPVEGGTRITESYEVRTIPLWVIDIPTTEHESCVRACATHLAG